MQFDYQSQKAIIEEQEKFSEHEGELYDAGLESQSQVPPKQPPQAPNQKKNTFFSSNNNQQSTMSASNTNNTSLFGGSVGGMSGHHGDAGRKNQYNQMGQWDVASPNPQFGASAGAMAPQSKSSSGISTGGAPH
jgi:hypothetical protein